MTPGRLERQLGALVRRGYGPATFSNLVEGRTAGRALVVTFDDAYRSVLEHAAPVLERLGLVGTVFVPTAYTGQDAPMTWPGIEEWLETEHRDELLPMDWDELGTLADGGWEIGSHTCTHPKLTQLDDATLAHELTASRETLEAQMGRPCRTIAYPYGDQDARVREATRDAGYVGGAALDRSMAGGNALCWPRVGMYERDSGVRFAIKSSATVHRVVRRLPVHHLGR